MARVVKVHVVRFLSYNLLSWLSSSVHVVVRNFFPNPVLSKFFNSFPTLSNIVVTFNTQKSSLSLCPVSDHVLITLQHSLSAWLFTEQVDATDLKFWYLQLCDYSQYLRFFLEIYNSLWVGPTNCKMYSSCFSLDSQQMSQHFIHELPLSTVTVRSILLKLLWLFTALLFTG